MDLFLAWILPAALLYLFFGLVMRSMGKKMGGGIMGVGQSNAKMYMENKTGVTFADVAGQDEAKESLDEIVDSRDAQPGFARMPVAIIIAHMIKVITVIEDPDPGQIS